MVYDGVLIPEYMLVSLVIVSISHAIFSTNNDVIHQEWMTENSTLYHNVCAMVGAT